MAYALVKTDEKAYNSTGVVIVGANTYLVDGTTTKAELPTDCPVGSKAVFIESGKTYFFGPSKTWTEFGGTSFIAE